MSRTKLKTYTDDDVRRITARDEYADGWYRWIVQKWQSREPEKGPISLRLVMAALEDPEDAASAFKLTQNLDLPLQETEDSGEIDGFRFEQTGEVGAILLDGVEPRAQWNKQERKWLLNGDEVSTDDAKAHNESRIKAGLNGLCAAYSDESNKTLDDLVGSVLYACITRTVSKNPQYAGRVFVNLNNIREELPEGAKLVPKGAFVFGKGAPKATAGAVAGKKAPAQKSARR